MVAAMAETYGTRPSELLGVSDSWLAFCVDEAIFIKLASERQGGDGGYRPEGFGPPDHREAISVPWGGEGPDPLAPGSAL